MADERLNSKVGILARIAALSGRVHRGASFDADAAAHNGVAHTLYSSLDQWQSSLDEQARLIAELRELLDRQVAEQMKGEVSDG